jgi:DNA-binding transcriptional ArsR family regulator
MSYEDSLPKRWQGVAGVFTALGDECRQRILLMFGPDKELTIKAVADEIPLSRTAVTHHIKVLCASGVLRSEKRGKEVFLRIDPQAVLEAIEAVRNYVRGKFRI